jgi:hypothetical protein
MIRRWQAEQVPVTLSEDLLIAAGALVSPGQVNPWLN